MRTIDRYVAREFLRLFLLFTLCAPVLFIIGDWTDNIDRYSQRGLTLGNILLGYVYQMPLFISWSFPVAALIATVFTVNNMTRHSEMTAAKAGGISFFRALAVLPVLGVLLTIAAVGLSELVPVTTAMRKEVMGEVEQMDDAMRHEFVYSGPDGHVFTIRRLTMNNQRIGGLTVDHIAGDDRVHIVAQDAVYDSLGSWRIGEGYMRMFVGANGATNAASVPGGATGGDTAGAGPAAGGGPAAGAGAASGAGAAAAAGAGAGAGAASGAGAGAAAGAGAVGHGAAAARGVERAFHFTEMRLRSFRETPEQLMARTKEPEEMRYAELGAFIAVLERSGVRPLKLMVERAQKIAIPVATLVIVLFGAPLANSSARGGAAYGIGISLGITVLYMLLFRMTGAAGAAGSLDPLYAAWLPNAVFLVAAIVLLVRVRT